jgi:uncharacterized protein
MLRHLMLLPALGCQARCGYCFGPLGKGPVMTLGTLETTLAWAKSLSGPRARSPEVVFHGGEPLLAGTAFYRQALPRLRQDFGDHDLCLSIQSNLWQLTDELCDLFTEHRVSLGTSLDGPEAINDAQRGEGYFRRTMAGIERARRHGLTVGCICTFTPASAPRYREIFDFFASEQLDFSIHAAVPPLNSCSAKLPQSLMQGRNVPPIGGMATNTWALSPEAYGDLLVNLLDLYLANLKRVRIKTLDGMCRSVSAGEGGVCTFRDCLGHFLAIAPDGAIYPCQRFVGHTDWQLGSVRNHPTWEQLEQSTAWQLLLRREEQVKEACSDCPDFATCKGGCPYDAVVAKGCHGDQGPYCSAYRRIFANITDRALGEVFSEVNLKEVVCEPNGGTFLRQGPLLTLMRGGEHPADIARRARELLAAVALAVSSTPEEAATLLGQAGLVTRGEDAVASLAALRRRLTMKSPGFLNLYLHVTYACNLRCRHCYAESSPDRCLFGKVLSVGDIGRMIRDANTLGFRKAVITGGEPLVYPERDHLFGVLDEIRKTAKPLKTVLRTNLAVALDSTLLHRIAHCTDQVVVSVDGDKVSHDARRGAGSYNRTVANLRTLIQAGPSAEIVLAAALSTEHASGASEQAVNMLAEELGGLSVRFRPILPLGRTCQNEQHPKLYGQEMKLKAREAMVHAFRPSTTCGVGNSLYVGPQGDTYPCYALTSESDALGNACGPEGLNGVIQSDRYRALSKNTVDTNYQCRDCSLRYVCGGGCRAWDENPKTGTVIRNLNAPPSDCRTMFSRARVLLDCALETLEVPSERWLAAGLPLP